MNTVNLIVHAMSPLDGLRNRSTMPFVRDDCAPPGCSWEFDYEFESESREDLPMVRIVTVRLVAHDGSEYPVRVGSLDGRWLAETEALIADEVVAEAEALALSRSDDWDDGR